MSTSRLETLLAERVAPVLRRARRARALTLGAAIGAGAGTLALLLRLAEERQGWNVGHGWTALVLATVAAAVWAWRRSGRDATDPRQAARLIEAQQPELRALLLTAVSQTPGEDGQLSYLQQQLIQQAVDRSDPVRWAQAVSTRRLGALGAASAGAALLVGYCALTGLAPDLPSLFDDDYGLRVTPGHTQAERGTNVLVLARFGDKLPGRATLVVRPPGKPPVRLEMKRTLGDPVWGALTPALTGDRVEYFVEHDGGRSPRYRISVFQAPDVQRLDARIEYPRQPAVPARDVVDARFLSVMEGARVTVTVRLAGAGKNVQEVRLVSKADQGTAAETVRLGGRDEGEGKGRVFWGVLAPRSSRRYDVLVVDRDGRHNDTPPRLSIDVHRNQPPQIAQAFPGKDVRVSPLEELTVEARISDDTAVLGHGLTYRLAGRPERELRLGGPAKPTSFTARATILLEDLGARPDELLTYHFWAEDHDGNGKLRRMSGDMYFAEVRPFEERFREQPGGEGEGEGEGQGGELADKTRRQKAIMNATWRLEREARDGRAPGALAKDVLVVASSQQELQQSTEALRGEAREGRVRAALQSATQSMGQAVRTLQRAGRGDAGPVRLLAEALEAQQRAYAALLRLRDRERNVTRGRSRGGQGGEEGQNPELSGLELKQKDSRYETRREASAAGRQDRSEREALSRLDELARRQSALSERLKEAQTALERAPEDEAEAQRRLKRLREEQQELLEDMDQLARKLEQAGQSGQAGQAGQAGQQNQQNGSEAEAQQRQREALERTRAELERSRKEAAAAAEALAAGQTGRALGASTRAQRELDRARGDLARNVGAGLEEEMRSLRDAARSLDETQRGIGQALGGPTAESQAQAQANPTQPGEAPGQMPGRAGLQGPETVNPTEARRLSSTLRQQRQEANRLLEQLEKLSGEAEATAPLLSRKLYDGLREAKMSDLEVALETAGELLDRNLADEARANEARARRGIGELRGRMEDAAKTVLGDEARALQSAQAELDALLAEAAQENNNASTNASPGGTPGASPPSPPGSTPGQGKGATPGSSAGSGSQPGSGSEPGEGQARASQPGNGPGAGQEGPITGQGFRGFAERLRDVEDLLDDSRLRNQAAGVRDRARALRADWKYQSKRPSATLMREQILGPLTELRTRVAERLDRLERDDKLVPLDRDPIPGRYTDLVRRYWKSLSQGR